jgi:hypothetical protein
MRTLLNCTPHNINIYLENGEVITIPSSGIEIRVNTEQVPAGEININGKVIPLVISKPKGITFLKNKQPMSEEEIKQKFEEVSGVITSAMVANYKDLIKKAIGKPVNVFVPNTDPKAVVRDSEGRIVGVKSLILVP